MHGPRIVRWSRSVFRSFIPVPKKQRPDKYPMRAKPLSGIRILDLTRLLPGPVCTLHLADLGADVVKIEDTGAGDYARAMGAGIDAMGPFFRMVNRNKRSLAIDLKNTKGRDAFLALVRSADALVE